LKKKPTNKIYQNQHSHSKFSEIGLEALLKRYKERIDLQDAFPGVKDGNYRSLINWAKNVLSKKWNDPDYQYFSL